MWSSRKIDKLAYENVVYKYLAGNEIERGIAIDEEKDQFLCSGGGILSKKGEYEYNGKPVYAYYGANCAECPFRSECAGEGKIRTITSDGYEGERRRMTAKMRSEAGQEAYKRRKETVECLSVT